MIEVLTHAHAEVLAKLHQGAFHSPWPESEFRAHIDRACDDVLGVVEEGVVHGFIVMRTQDDQAEILTVVVGDAYQNQGLGMKILTAGENAVAKRGADIVFLDVAADTPAAIHLYQKAKYQRCGTRKGYYRREKGRVDAFLFSKHI